MSESVELSTVQVNCASAAHDFEKRKKKTEEENLRWASFLSFFFFFFFFSFSFFFFFFFFFVCVPFLPFCQSSRHRTWKYKMI